MSDSTSDSLSDSEFIPDSDSGNDDSGRNSNWAPSGNHSSGYLPKTGAEDGPFLEVGLSAMGLALLAAISAKKKKKNED
ncbi:LPXTG cell wall anchor domain-containing protein [Lactococcus lactis]|uniref:LPXTG cell wall anchor domain-containing protein n=1 Tax=Lactococcus lactis TaxID=1358 RepID=UPI00237986AC|nr:LPXTG cell wall anchor domain-containing protein [Lactococcus lactis]WDA67617.1 LPXTG cell wall anchor domain-containing protein [Lactococcus lactis]